MNGHKWKVFGISSASGSAILAAALAWGQLDLPRPAWYSEVAALEITVAANTQLILGDRWLRITAQIAELRTKLIIDPTNRELIERLAVFQLQLREIELVLK